MRGTPAFMAPEVFRLHRCSEASEICSVGLVLYSLLEGRFLPYARRELAEVSVLRRLAGLPLPMFTSCSSPIAAAAYQTILDLTAFDPAERIASFEEAIQALQQLRERLRKTLDCWTSWPQWDAFRFCDPVNLGNPYEETVFPGAYTAPAAPPVLDDRVGNTVRPDFSNTLLDPMDLETT